MSPPPLPTAQLPPPLRKASQRLPSYFYAVLVVAVLVVGFVGFHFVKFIWAMESQTLKQISNSGEYTRADGFVLGYKGTPAHGNTFQAQALAWRLSDELKKIRDDKFPKGDPESVDVKLTRGEFLVFCQLRGDSCAFLIHVPALREYSSAQKVAISEAAYLEAARQVDSIPRSGVRQLGVAIRGTILYDRAIVGAYRFESKAPLASVRRTDDWKFIHQWMAPFFAPGKDVDVDVDEDEDDEPVKSP